MLGYMEPMRKSLILQGTPLIINLLIIQSHQINAYPDGMHYFYYTLIN